jgi:hypothetical protein
VFQIKMVSTCSALTTGRSSQNCGNGTAGVAGTVISSSEGVVLELVLVSGPYGLGVGRDVVDARLQVFCCSFELGCRWLPLGLLPGLLGATGRVGCGAGLVRRAWLGLGSHHCGGMTAAGSSIGVGVGLRCVLARSARQACWTM